MGERTEELRREIELTRSDLGDTLDAIGDRVSPGRVIERRKARMTGGVRSVMDRVMGKAHDLQDSVSSAGHGAADSAHAAPQAVLTQAQGTPLIAGAVAFALGFVIAAAVPPSEMEKSAAAPLADKVEPLKAQLTQVGQEVAENLREPAQQAVAELKSVAQEGAQSVTETAQQSKAETTDRMHEAVDTVKGNTPT